MRSVLPTEVPPYFWTIRAMFELSESEECQKCAGNQAV